MKVLVVFEINPERVEFYLFNNPAPHILKSMKLAHNSIANSVDCDGDEEDAINEVADHFEDSNVEKLDPSSGPFESMDLFVYFGMLL